jgi:hypothetical protein
MVRPKASWKYSSIFGLSADCQKRLKTKRKLSPVISQQRGLVVTEAREAIMVGRSEGGLGMADEMDFSNGSTREKMGAVMHDGRCCLYPLAQGLSIKNRANARFLIDSPRPISYAAATWHSFRGEDFRKAVGSPKKKAMKILVRIKKRVQRSDKGEAP